MKAHVYVTLKRTVLDAQGQTIADALRLSCNIPMAELAAHNVLAVLRGDPPVTPVSAMP